MRVKRVKKTQSKPEIITYDKYTNKGNSIVVERRTIEAESREIALRRMKEDVYRNGIAGAVASAKLSNGEVIDFKVYREPKKKLSRSELYEKSRIIKREILSRGERFGEF